MKNALKEEIKDQYNQEFDIKKTLETKANNITTISGTVAGLFFGFGQFLIGKLIDIHYDRLWDVILLLIVGISLNIVTIAYSMMAWKEKNYYYILNGEVKRRKDIAGRLFSTPIHDYEKRRLRKSFASWFHPKNKEAKQESEKVEDPDPKIFEAIKLDPSPANINIKYMHCINKNARINARKASKVKLSQYIFIVSMIIIVAPLVVLIINLPTAKPVFVWEAMDVISQGTLTSYGQVSGLVNVPAKVFLTVDNVNATYDCLNGPSHLHSKIYEKNVRGTQQDLSPSNDQISFGVNIQVPVNTSATSCPHTNGVMKLATVSYNNAVLHIQQNGTDILTQRHIIVSHTE